MRMCWGLILGVLVAASARAEEVQRFDVIIGGTRVGQLQVAPSRSGYAIDYGYKNNGRGPNISETLRLDAQGLPQHWTIRGSTTFGSAVDERFQRSGARAEWHDASGRGSASSAAKALYVAQSASPWALGVYARALLGQDGHRLPALPGGELRLEIGDPLAVSNEAGSLEVRAYALSGLDLNPSYLLLDQDNALFAQISPRMVLLREGYQGEEARLRKLAADLAAKRLRLISQQAAHAFSGPVRLRNVRIFQPDTLELSEPLSVVTLGPRISSIQPLTSPSTEGETLIEGEGGTLLPGLFEMHAHSGDASALLNVLAGVTSMRDMGNNNEVLSELIARIESGELIGPRITRSGFIEGKSPFSSNNGRLVDSEQAAIDAVRWYAARGFWQVKLYNSLNPAWSPATIAEAHRLGLRVAGHVPAFSNANAMIAAGYDELTHINQIMLGWPSSICSRRRCRPPSMRFFSTRWQWSRPSAFMNRPCSAAMARFRWASAITSIPCRLAISAMHYSPGSIFPKRVTIRPIATVTRRFSRRCG